MPISARSSNLPARPASTQPARLRPAGGGVLDLGRLLIGISVVAIGVLFLLDAAGTVDAGQVLDRWWPSVIVAAGVFTLLERPPSIVRGTLLAVGGVVLLLFTTDVLDADSWDYIWPLAVIAAGLAIAASWRGRAVPSRAGDLDTIRSTAVFGGTRVVSSSPRFRSAWLTAVFGGVTLDLRDAVPDPDGATVNATVAFGGADILVPSGWRISVRSLPIFGGVEDKTEHSGTLPEDAPLLRIDGVALFGSIDVKHKK